LSKPKKAPSIRKTYPVFKIIEEPVVGLFNEYVHIYTQFMLSEK